MDTIKLLKERKICVVIPTYNNAGTLGDVVARSLTQCQDVIVVNDGSTDGTKELLNGTEGITCIHFPKNRGKGIALKMGLRRAKEMGFAYAITMDADGQHFPEDIPVLLEGNLRHPGAIIIGRRRLEGAERSAGSKFANAFGNFWYCVQTLQWQPDTQSGFRLYPLHKLYCLGLLTSRYEAELELLVFPAWNGTQVKSVPVNVYYPPRSERVSHFRPGADFTRIFILNTFLCALALVYGYPRILLRSALLVARNAFSLLFYIGSLCILMPFALVYAPIAKWQKWGPAPLQALLHVTGKTVTWLLPFISGKVTIHNTPGETFSRPAIIICNHQSHLDSMMLLGLNRKMVFLTNDWVYNSPSFGYALRHADYNPVSIGIEKLRPKVRDLLAKGYFVSVFPEGTRSEDCSVGRFHKGAFRLASDLGADILPVVLYGTGRVLPKKGRFLRRSPISLHIEKRISPEEAEKLGDTMLERSKWFRHFYIRRLSEISNEIEQNV